MTKANQTWKTCWYISATINASALGLLNVPTTGTTMDVLTPAYQAWIACRRLARRWGCRWNRTCLLLAPFRLLLLGARPRDCVVCSHVAARPVSPEFEPSESRRMSICWRRAGSAHDWHIPGCGRCLAAKTRNKQSAWCRLTHLFANKNSTNFESQTGGRGRWTHLRELKLLRHITNDGLTV